MKKFTGQLLALGMALTLLPGAALAAESSKAHLATGAPNRVLAGLKQSPYTFAGGSGTREDPYLVSTPDQLNAIRQGLDRHYKLVSDIDLSAWGDWMPIGGEELERHGDPTPFTGSLDGAGHVVRGMTITGKRCDYQREDQALGFEAHCFGLFAHVKGREEKTAPGDAYEDVTLGGVSDLGVVDFNINIDPRHRRHRRPGGERPHRGLLVQQRDRPDQPQRHGGRHRWLGEKRRHPGVLERLRPHRERGGRHRGPVLGHLVQPLL